MIGSDFDTAYNQPLVMGPSPYQYAPVCKAPECFIGSYAPVTPAGHTGPYWVNTYFLEPSRRREIAGPVVIRSGMFKCNA
jgi:hypothetical protein